MKRNLIITNAMAIAFEASRENWGSHLTLEVSDHYAELTIFFETKKADADRKKKIIEHSTSYTPETRVFHLNPCDVWCLMAKWELPES